MPQISQFSPEPVVDNAAMLKDIFNELKGNKDSLSAIIGDLESVTKQHERMTCYIRGTGSYDVRMCPNQVGTVIHGQRHEQISNAASWHQHEIQYSLTTRKCYAAATISIGGSTVKDSPDHCITAAEFNLVSQHEIDNFKLSEHYRMEKRTDKKLYFGVRSMWVENNERMHLMLGSIWGMEWVAVMNKCVQGLVARNTEFPHVWDLTRIQDTFEEIKARFRNELLHLDI